MEKQDDIAVLLDRHTNSHTKVLGVVFSIGLLFLLFGIGSLRLITAGTSTPTNSLPPFPSQKQLDQIQTREEPQLQVNVNTATLEDLDALEGVGLIRAQGILKSRPYVDYEDLMARSGVPVSVLEKNKRILTF